MVAMMAVQFNQKHGSWAAHSPGELEGMANQAVYLSPNGKPSGGDYIAAYKGSGRRLPMADAYNSEAQQLKEAELDLRMNAKVERVFGNGLFENGESQLAPKNSSSVKLNNLFNDDKKQNLNSSLNSTGGRDASGGPDKGVGLAARRNGNSTPVKRRDPAPNVTEGTEVKDFHDPDEDTMPVVGRTRGAGHNASVAQNYNTWEAQLKHLIASGRREEAVRMPAAPTRMTRCYVKRVKSLFSTHCCFQMYMDSSDIFLLAARKRKKSKTSSYVISLDLDDLKRDTENCMAKLKANFVGTEYTLWGRRPQDGSISGDDFASDNGNENRKGYGREDLCINFKQTALKSKGGPRSMYVIVPQPGVEQAVPQMQDNSLGSLSHCLELARKKELPPFMERRFSMMCTKQPEWDANMKAFTLDFQGRVKEASVKNFQLIGWDHNTDRATGELLLQFGKQSDDVYALDFTYPFTVESAFAIALASIDTKLCYTI